MPLPEPRTPAGRAALDALVAAPESALLALDFDGTLAPIVERPEDARALPGAVPAISALAQRLAVVAVITGRPAAQAARLGGFAETNDLERLVILGAYGRERWSGARREVTAPPVPPGVDEVRRKLPAMLEGAPAGVNVEDKGAALVVHTRQAAEPAVALGRLQGPLAAMAERHGLVIEQARLAVELRPPGYDKGGALRSLVDGNGVRTAVFIGDDLGDMPAFEAIDELCAGGMTGLKVCSASDEVPQMADRADLILDGPSAVVGFLEALVEAVT